VEGKGRRVKGEGRRVERDVDEWVMKS